MTLVDLPLMQGVGQRSSTFVFDLLSPELSRIGSLDVDLDRPPTIDNNVNRTIKRTLSGLWFPTSQASDVNMLRDRVRVRMIMGGVSYPVGVFMFADAATSRSTGGDWVDANLVDQGVLLNQGLAETYALPPGYSIQTALAVVLSRRLLIQLNITPTDAKIRGDQWVVWPAGTPDMQVVNDLCAMAGYYSVYWDNQGFATCRPVPDMGSMVPDIVYDAGTSVLTHTVTVSNNQIDAPNRYIVVNNGLTDVPISGFWDVPPGAPHSIQNRGGVVVTKVIDAQGVQDSAQAAAIAKAYGESDGSTYEHATFSTAINPRHDTFDIVSWEGKNFHEQDWSFVCREGADQRHDLRRCYSEDMM